MDWTEAIVKVLREAGGGPMHVEDITSNIINKGYYSTRSQNPVNTVDSYLSTNKKLFQNTEKGYYKLIGTPAPATPTTVARVAPVVVSSCTSVRPCTSYHPGDAKYKCALDFVDSTVEKHADLSDLEMKLLELIVNFRLFLVNGEVCFAADILDNLEVQILDEEGKRPQSIDATLLQKKLNELNEQIAKTERELQNNPQFEKLYGLLKRMSSAAKEANERLNNASDGKVKFKYPILGEFIPGSNPKVVIYLKSIEKSIKKRKEEYPRRSESRWQVMAAVFVHEMFHAWNYVKAGRMKRSVLAIDEPMVEFETLYFLKELEAFTKSLSHHLHENWKSRVQDKQQSIGDVAAYGFGYYLFDKLSEIDADESIKWIETYSKKSASINGSYPLVEKAEKALNPVYPFKSESKVMGWFKKIIFDDRATSKTVGKSATAKVSNTMSEVIYKIRVNRPCRLFIDDEELMTLKENELTKITLPKGEYLRKVVAEDDSTIFDEKVISLFHPTVDDIALDAISLEEAKRNALLDEFFQGDLCFKPTKDRSSVVVVDKKAYVDVINIPNQIKYAGYVYPVIEVRLHAPDLKSITIPDGVKGICFEDCSSLTSIIIPNSLTYITWDAFKGCSSLRSITIPDSVTRIYNYAFEDCDLLTVIDYTGTKEQWEKIEKDEFWKGLYKSIEIRCTDGNM